MVFFDNFTQLFDSLNCFNPNVETDSEVDESNVNIVLNIYGDNNIIDAGNRHSADINTDSRERIEERIDISKTEDGKEKLYKDLGRVKRSIFASDDSSADKLSESDSGELNSDNSLKQKSKETDVNKKRFLAKGTTTSSENIRTTKEIFV